MKLYANRLKSLRESFGYSQQKLADLLGVSRSAVGMYETGQREPDFELSEAIADLFNVDMDYLIGRSDTPRRQTVIPPGFELPPKMVSVPLIGAIACGEPITAEQNIEGYVSVPERWQATFTLACRGHSMEPKIKDGDIVAIRSDLQVENGQIAAVRIGDEATLKKVYYYPERLILRPVNDDYEEITVEGEKMNEVRIEGKAIGLCRDL